MSMAWTFGEQHCPNETGYEWLYDNFAGSTVGADEGLTLKCIKEAGMLI